MRNSWFPILTIVVLLGLLVLLATLQYQWLGQISDAEQTRLEARLKDDTSRFAKDFNNEIQSVYMFFSLTDDNWSLFKTRKDIWNEKTKYEKLIKDFHFVKTNSDNELTRFDEATESFVSSEWDQNLKQIIKTYEDESNQETYIKDGSALIIPIQKESISKSKKIIRVKKNDGTLLTENIVGQNLSKLNAKQLVRQELKKTQKLGNLIIRLDENVIKNEILTNLSKKYFSQSEGGDYKVSVTDENNSTVFQTHNEKIDKSDAKAKLFNLRPKGFIFLPKQTNITFSNDNKYSKDSINKSASSMISIESATESFGNENLDIDIIDNKNSKVHIAESFFTEESGIWTLNVQHIDGSLEQFITNTRRRNLAISFGILSLLAVSIILIFLSSQRAKLLAQKQMDFVSSVSHEFRTPLAVIYSAGENLSDGVIEEREKISNYGGLIKREGKKLSGMVEQILEFAGANSGKRKYDFRKVNINNVIGEALEECQAIIEEKDFVVEKHLADSLPNIYADEKALTLAVQNLINNSLKYSNGTKWLKISTQMSAGRLIVTIADKGFGISAKDKKQIFEPFYRAKNVVDEQINGNGLGLSLVKQIIDAHDGEIDVESEVGKGSEFTIRLPLNA